MTTLRVASTSQRYLVILNDYLCYEFGDCSTSIWSCGPCLLTFGQVVSNGEKVVNNGVEWTVGTED